MRMARAKAAVKHLFRLCFATSVIKTKQSGGDEKIKNSTKKENLLVLAVAELANDNTGKRTGRKFSRYRLTFAEKNLLLSVKPFSFHFLLSRVVWITPSSLEGRGGWRL